MLFDLTIGQHFDYEQVTPMSLIKSQTTPISMRDIYQQMVALGVPGGVALNLLGQFGVNTWIEERNRRGPQKKRFSLYD